MLIVLANWLFILVLCGAWGFPLYRLLRKWTTADAPEAALTHVILLGLLSLTTLCNLGSLWFPVDMKMCLSLSIGAVLLCGFNYRSWRAYLKKQHESFSLHRITAVYFLLLLAIALIKTIGPSEIEDEAAYHLPLIRWMEHYPVVPGIANIEDRMGFNPVSYIANALFGVSWLYKGGLYDLNSLLFVLVGGSFLYDLRRLLQGAHQHLLSGAIQALSLVFLFRIYLTSMDADFLNIYGVIYLLVNIIRKMEANQMRFGQADWQSAWALLFFCFLVTNKFSAILMAPIAFWLLLKFIQEKQLRALTLTVVCVSLIVFSWIARNYYISGFMVYPVYFLDLFDVDWKTPPELVVGQYHYVSEFAKTELVRPFNTYVLAEPSLKDWLPVWFSLIWQQLLGKVVVLGMGASLLLWFHTFLFKKNRPFSDLQILAGLLFFAIAIWFWRIPALRFGWPWLLTFIAISLFIHLQPSIKAQGRLAAIGLYILLAVSLLRSTIVSVQEGFDLKKHWLHPAPVAYEANYSSQHLSQIKVEVAADDFCRDALPPCLPKHYHPGLQARGNRVEDGFRIGGK